jgi:hypothetical protein
VQSLELLVLGVWQTVVVVLTLLCSMFLAAAPARCWRWAARAARPAST